MLRLFHRFRFGVFVLSSLGIASVHSTWANNLGGVRTTSQSALRSTNNSFLVSSNGSFKTINPGSTVSLNPQPLPPKVFFSGGNFGDTVMLNPQPLPPKWKVIHRTSHVKK